MLTFSRFRVRVGFETEEQFKEFRSKVHAQFSDEFFEIERLEWSTERPLVDIVSDGANHGHDREMMNFILAYKE